MLPLVDRPIIHFAVEEAVASGIEQVIIVTSQGKRSVEDYFDRARDVEAALERRGDREALAQIKAISDMANIAYVRQQEMLGIGHAVQTAQHLIEDEPFVLFLPDDVMIGEPPVTAQLIEAFDAHGKSVVAVQEVPAEETASYGIVAGEPMDDRLTRLTTLVEKPAPAAAPSRLAIVGRYVFTPAIFDAIERTSHGVGGEIQITDAMQILANEEGMYSYRFEGERFDTGRPLSLLIASIALGLRRPDVGPPLRRYLASLDLNEA
jgi:UTP--glucose-1-phosphate uridylyltransferase